MSKISFAKTQHPIPSSNWAFARVKAVLSELFRRHSARQCLLVELDRLPENAVRDIGLLQADVTSLREASVFGDAFGQLASRFQERSSIRNWP